ncbi:MAG: hypothetical protein AAF580_07935, partial [Pseudomonadota bacterium]
MGLRLNTSRRLAKEGNRQGPVVELNGRGQPVAIAPFQGEHKPSVGLCPGLRVFKEDVKDKLVPSFDMNAPGFSGRLFRNAGFFGASAQMTGNVH